MLVFLKFKGLFILNQDTIFFYNFSNFNSVDEGY